MGYKTSPASPFVFNILGKQKQYETVKTENYLQNMKRQIKNWDIEK